MAACAQAVPQYNSYAGQPVAAPAAYAEIALPLARREHPDVTINAQVDASNRLEQFNNLLK